MKIGILAVQGAFAEHKYILEKLGCECILIRQKSDITDIDGLVLPGGESTVQGKLLHELDIFPTLFAKINDGLPTMATCAGLILLAQHISNDSNTYFGTLPVTVKRNAYGRQLGSFVTKSSFGPIDNIEMTFIRAPYVENVSDEVEILSTVDDRIVAVEYKNQIGLAFHPELCDDTRIHQYFLDKIVTR